MYLNCRVKIPDTGGKITSKTIGGTPYIYYEYARVYNKTKKYSEPKRTCIGKRDPEQPAFLHPNEKFLKYFPRELLPPEKDGPCRSGCLHIGAYLEIRKIVSDYHLDEMIARIIGKEAGLFIDLAAYSIITEDNAGQYYPDYAYDHALFTDNMKIYSDSKVSDFLQEVTVDQRIRFLNEWNAKRDHREKIYISYDSTNKISRAGDIDLIELGHAKEGIERDIFNYSIAYDRNNREPLFYEAYLGAHCERVYSNESIDTKIFIGFVATIIRSRIYTLLKDETGRMDKKQNYMTVPAALKELEKIELLKGGDNEYNLDYAITATQKTILNAFDMTSENVEKQARGISSDLARIRIEAAEAEAAKVSDDMGVSKMTRRRLTLDERIEKAEKNVRAAKEKYDSAPDDLEGFVTKRKEMDDKKLLEAYHSGDKTIDEIIEFIQPREVSRRRKTPRKRR